MRSRKDGQQSMRLSGCQPEEKETGCGSPDSGLLSRSVAALHQNKKLKFKLETLFSLHVPREDRRSQPVLEANPLLFRAHSQHSEVKRKVLFHFFLGNKREWKPKWAGVFCFYHLMLCV